MSIKDTETAIINLQRDISEIRDSYERLRERVAINEAKLKRYDSLAAKWGGFLLGITTVGVILANGIDSIKSKLIQWLAQ